MDTEDRLNAETTEENLSQNLKELIHLVRCNSAPDHTLASVQVSIGAAIDSLTPYRQDEGSWSGLSRRGGIPPSDWKAGYPNIAPYSPVTGSLNPIAPAMHLRHGDNEVLGEVTFTPIYAGPLDSVHGGMIAAVFDELLSTASILSKKPGLTASLTINYHRTTPINTPIEIWAVNESSSGRKQTCRGEMRVNGEVTASAEGIFISVEE